MPDSRAEFLAARERAIQTFAASYQADPSAWDNGFAAAWQAALRVGAERGRDAAARYCKSRADAREDAHLIAGGVRALTTSQLIGGE